MPLRRRSPLADDVGLRRSEAPLGAKLRCDGGATEDRSGARTADRLLSFSNAILVEANPANFARTGLSKRVAQVTTDRRCVFSQLPTSLQNAEVLVPPAVGGQRRRQGCRSHRLTLLRTMLQLAAQSSQLFCQPVAIRSQFGEGRVQELRGIQGPSDDRSRSFESADLNRGAARRHDTQPPRQDQCEQNEQDAEEKRCQPEARLALGKLSIDPVPGFTHPQPASARSRLSGPR